MSAATAERATTLDFAAQAEAIDDARNRAYEQLRAANTRGLTIDDVDAFDDAMAAVAARCEILRRKFYPRHHRLVVTCGAALTVSATGRRCRVVWRRSR